MIGEMRHLRKRLGLTQAQVAEHLKVDQGTVSRWERGVEAPWPANLAALRDLLMVDNQRKVRDRSLALVRLNLLPACLLDPSTKLTEVSDLCVQHYRKLHDIDIRSKIGVSFERHVNELGNPELWDVVKESGLISGDILLLRFVRNLHGKGHVTHYEPVFEDGELLGFEAHVTARFSFPKNNASSIEKVDVLHADNPSRMVTLFEGPLSKHIDFSSL